ncbi:histone H4 [Sarotherodon galilaeus]
MKLVLLLLLCHSSFAVKHSLKYYFTGSSGVPNIPECIGVMMVNDIHTGYCDTGNMTLQPRKDWTHKILANDPQQYGFYNPICFGDQPNMFRIWISILKNKFNQSAGVHIIQMKSGCEWDENTGEAVAVLQYAYNGDDFLELDFKTLTWIALKPEADFIKMKWDVESATNVLTHLCPEWLKIFVDSGKHFQLKTVLPSVSLLQKTPSSPVSCHATGFYPDRAMMFWRKDGEEIHEGVDHGEILPNSDDTFQMSVDLIVSSITPEDWRKYECVFQLSGVEDIVTKLNEAVIRTNSEENIRKENASSMMIPIIAAVVVFLVLILIAAVGFAVYRKKKKKDTEPSPGDASEVENLRS